MVTVKNIKFLILILTVLLFTQAQALQAQEAQQEQAALETQEDPQELAEVEVQGAEVAAAIKQAEEQPLLTLAEAMPAISYTDPLQYTLGPEDVVEITVLRHPEFSGIFPVNLEGKI
ncbi:MAG: hypothetical protein DRP74_04540 [Candidatus Omnitrophota bacterium]|nr:MAG: hypothetical protein DRP74_04540 [Candidatus Omnitrophota bacterium]